MLRLLVDATALADDSSRRGVGTYVRGLLPALVAQPDVAVVALATADTALPDGVDREVIRRVAPPRWAALEADLRLAGEIRRRRDRADVFLCPSVRPPRRSALPYVQVLHDVIPLAFPDPRFEPARRLWRRFAPRYRRADAVVAVSAASARDGVTHLGLDPAKVHAVLSGLIPPPPGPDAPPPGDPYVLVASTWSPNKGFEEAMAVVGRLADAGSPIRLVISGQQDPYGSAEIERLRLASPHPDRVVVSGWVDDIGALFRGATAVLVPSRIEGYGYPAAEAMAYGAPLVAFDNSSLPEVVGDGGVLVPDGDVDAMAAAVRRIAGDPAEAARLRAAGPARAAELRWDDTAARIVELCRAVRRA